jgi:NAD(P)-dependent dehydrogenase (short-subunit alcohol dehydrogenase family)
MNLEQLFPQKRAFVTGASSGLGLAICQCLATKGWKLLIADINAERLANVERQLQELGATTRISVMDVTRYENLEEAANALHEAWGGVDLVFNNAGIASMGPATEIPLEEWERVIKIDLWSVIYGCKAFLPMLQQQGYGHIINTASSAGTLAPPEGGAYNVAKAGVVSLSETLKIELGQFNIGVTVVCPTVFASSLGDSMKGERVFEKKLLKQVNETRVTANDIACDVISAIEKGRLYVMTQQDARWGWRIKRLFPEFYPKMVSYLYRNKKWIYAE